MYMLIPLNVFICCYLIKERVSNLSLFGHFQEADLAEILSILVELPQVAYDLTLLRDETFLTQVALHAGQVEMVLQMRVVKGLVLVGYHVTIWITQVKHKVIDFIKLQNIIQDLTKTKPLFKQMRVVYKIVQTILNVCLYFLHILHVC